MFLKNMSRNIKWKLAIIAGITEYLVHTEAKYCAFEIHGEPKYYMCPRTEYCCNFGCCVSPGFQIYHLWYYWLLVIIMFLVCSGGGWWYRYWLQGRYRAAASSIPTRSSNSRTQNALRGPTCQAQQARITYNTARNTVLLQRMWKGPHRSTTSPAYNGSTTTASVAHYQNTSVVLNDTNCPYYKLYGPPPSYETVIAQTRSKFPSPSSPHLLQPNQSSLLSIPTASNTTGFVAQCFYNVPDSLTTELEVPNYSTPRLENFETAEYVRLIPEYETTQENESSHFVRGFCYDRSSDTNPGKSSNNYDEVGNPISECNTASSQNDQEFSIPTMNYLNSPYELDRSVPCNISSGKFTSRVGVHRFSRRQHMKFDSSNSSLSEVTSEPIATTSSTFDFENYFSSSNRPSCHLEQRKIQTGSLKITRRQRQQVKYQEAHQINQNSIDSASTSRQNPDEFTRFNSQLNPSNNVILAVNADVDVLEQRYDRYHRHSQQQQRSAVFTIVEQSSTNSNLESKRKLDRSRSLD